MMREHANTQTNLPGSFRDPSGFIFQRDGTIYRQINTPYKETYEAFMASGLYKDLTKAGLLISHNEAPTAPSRAKGAYKVIRPEPIPFISYPYEWCFSQLKHAALTTLEIQKRSLKFNMSLKDASAYNIQFRSCKPVLIDTLSFEKYKEGKPWVAYKQFCQHFLSPLALMSRKDIRLSQLLRIYADGIPLDLASSLLPSATRFSFSLSTHIHLHAKCQNLFADKRIKKDTRVMSRFALLGLVDSLESAIGSMKLRRQKSEWSDYYDDTNYSSNALKSKKHLVSRFLDEVKPRTAWDLGANTGIFSRVAADKGVETISFDIDPNCVEKNYLECIKDNKKNILPLISDLTNPSSGLGWENMERASLIERGPTEIALALALIHHLAISNNLPFEKIASFLSKICSSLIIEFVPKEDSQAQKLLNAREDIFSNYTQDNFEAAFKKLFTIERSENIANTKRRLYLMRKV